MASRNPAWMSHLRVRETSAGDSGIALLSGSRACSIRSRICRLVSTGWVCWPPKRAQARSEHGTGCHRGRAEGEYRQHHGDKNDDDQNQKTWTSLP